MKRAVIAFGVLVVVVVAMAANALVLSPRSKERADLRQRVEQARQEEASLQANLAELRRLAADGTTREAELARLGKLVPDTPDIAGFIRTMNDVAAEAQVDFSSLVPSTPEESLTGGPATLKLNVHVAGTFFQILDYLKRVENLDRLVVIDAIDLASAGGTGGTPKLSVNIRGRTFSASAADITAGAA